MRDFADRLSAKFKVQAKATALVQALRVLERKLRRVDRTLASPAKLAQPPYLNPLVEEAIVSKEIAADFHDSLRRPKLRALGAKRVLEKLREIHKDLEGQRRTLLKAIAAAADAYERQFSEPLVVAGGNVAGMLD